MQSKHSKERERSFDFNAWIGVLMLVCIIVWYSYRFINGYERSVKLKSGYSRPIIANIIDEKVYTGNSPVSRQFWYKYSFKVQGKNYYGDSRDVSKKVGDTIYVEYNITNPEINQAIKDSYQE